MDAKTELVKTEAKDGTNISTYKILSSDGKLVVGERVDVYAQTNMTVAELKESLGNIPQAARDILATLAPETRADVVALLYDSQGILIGVVPYSKDGSIQEVEAKQNEILKKAIDEGKTSPNPPYAPKSEDDPKPSSHGGPSLADKIQDAKDHGAPVGDGLPIGVVTVYGGVGGGPTHPDPFEYDKKVR